MNEIKPRVRVRTSCTFGWPIAKRLERYCEQTGLNRSRTVELAVATFLAWADPPPENVLSAAKQKAVEET